MEMDAKGHIREFLAAGNQEKELMPRAPMYWPVPDHEVPLCPKTGLPVKKFQYEIVRIQDSYVCDLTAFKILNKAIVSGNVELSAMLEKGYFYLCAPGCIQEVELPAGWRRWIVVGNPLPADKDSEEWTEHLSPFCPAFDASQYKRMRRSLQSYVAVCQEVKWDVQYNTNDYYVVFVTGDSLLYDCLLNWRVPELTGRAGNRTRLWNVSSSLDPRSQARILCNFFCIWDFTGDTTVPSWGPLDLLVNSVWDTFVCDRSAYVKLNTAAVDHVQGSQEDASKIRCALRVGGVLYKLKIQADDDQGGDAVQEYLGWKPWAVELGVSEAEVEDVAREVIGAGEEAEMLLEHGMVKSMRDFIAACIRKQQDEHHDVAKKLLVFCTANHEFFEAYLRCSRGWKLLKEIVGRILIQHGYYEQQQRQSEELDIVCRAWDVSASIDPCTQLLLEHPASAHVPAHAVVNYQAWRPVLHA